MKSGRQSGWEQTDVYFSENKAVQRAHPNSTLWTEEPDFEEHLHREGRNPAY